MSISDRLTAIQKTIATTARNCDRDPATIQLVAVSKYHSIASIEEAIIAGHRNFGENYIQEAAKKWQLLSDRANFHFIGHIQSNKAKLAAEMFSLVETVDRYKLARSLNNHLEKLGRSLDILIQVNIGQDPNKSGILPQEAAPLLEKISTLSRLRPRGLMTIPPQSESAEGSRVHFKNLRTLGTDLASRKLFTDNNKVDLSMGMSRDFKVAIEEGATIIRIGTAIFGQRKEFVK